MSREEIITALRNAVERGESLELAIQIMINSGYNPLEVNEAAKYVTRGVTPQLEPTEKESLIMPEEKSFFKKIRPSKSYLKEIILLIILVILMGILMITIIFREEILRFFSRI